MKEGEIDWLKVYVTFFVRSAIIIMLLILNAYLIKFVYGDFYVTHLVREYGWLLIVAAFPYTFISMAFNISIGLILNSIDEGVWFLIIGLLTVLVYPVIHRLIK